MVSNSPQHIGNISKIILDVIVRYALDSIKITPVIYYSQTPSYSIVKYFSFLSAKYTDRIECEIAEHYLNTLALKISNYIT